MIPFVDIHTHFQKNTEGVVFIQNFAQNQLYTPDLSGQGEGGILASAGLHPWFLTKENMENDFQKLLQIAENQNIAAIGECGLDKLRGEPIECQIQTFTKHIQLADSVQKPVIVHCVRAFNEVIALKKKLKPQVPMLIHGFNKNETILHDLLKNGFYISIGAAILRGGESFKNTVSQIPIERLFFETDDADIDIRTVYAAYAKHSNMDLDDLKSLIFTNFERIFKKKTKKETSE